MKTRRGRTGSNRSVFFVVFVAVFLSTVYLQAQPSTAVESMKASIQQTIDRLDANWDEASYNMPVYSTTYLNTKVSSAINSSSLGIYSFKGNVKDTPSQRVADQRLKQFAQLLRMATDEITVVYQRQNYQGELKELKPLLKYLGYTVSNKPISLRTMAMDRIKLITLKPYDFEQGTFKAEALTQVAENLASSKWMASNKHLAYKYLISNVLIVPIFWVYLEPEFSRLVREAGSTSDNIVYVKLHMNREPYILQDTRIWDKAARFQASQLKVVGADAGNQIRHVKRVEQSDTETKVTVRYNVGGRENWYRFDKSLVLVDNATKELYPIRRIENQIPLGKTFIVVGCEGKAVEFTFVFPPLKPSLKQFVLDDNVSVPSSDKAKKRYFKKHGIMSDGNGRSPIVIYNLSEFVSAATPSKTATSIQEQKMDELINKRVVTESKPDGGTVEWTYRYNQLVD